MSRAVLPFRAAVAPPPPRRGSGAVLVDACDALRRAGRLCLAAEVLEIASELDLGEEELARFDDVAERLISAFDRSLGER